MLASCGGCVEVTGENPRFEPVSIPDRAATPRAIVYGSFTALLPHYDVTPALEMFLYGPNDFGKTALRNAQGMALAGGRLLVCDQGWPDVVAVDLATGESTPFAHPDHRPRCPVAAAADDAHVYVADTKSWCVAVYDSKGKLLEELAPTTDPNRRFQPASLLVHENILHAGNIGQHRVDRFKLDTREWLPPLVPPPEAKRLVAPTGLARTADGTLLIVDGLQGQIQRLSAQGEWLRPIGRPGRGPGEFVRPKQVCVTSSGLIAVVDAGRQSLMVFGPDGEFLLEVFGTDGRWPGFTLPAGVVPLPPEQVPAVREPAQEYLLVSDSLGMPLTLVGLIVNAPREVAHGR